MKHLVIALSLVVAVGVACKTAKDAGPASQSGSAGSAVAGGSGSGSGGAGSAIAAGSALDAAGSGGAPQSDDFDDKVDLSKQPARSGDQQAIVDTAAKALRDLLSKAKAAKDGKEVCAALKPLGKQMAGLDKLQPPAGVDAKKFADAHDAVFSQIDPGPPGYCSDGEDTSADKMRYVVSDIRDRFVTFVTMGGS